eukprot:3062555-Amphidinium_carterae.1
MLEVEALGGHAPYQLMATRARASESREMRLSPALGIASPSVIVAVRPHPFVMRSLSENQRDHVVALYS